MANRKGRLGSYITPSMEEEIQKTMQEISADVKHRRSEAMKIVARRSQIGRDFEVVTKRMSSLPLFFQQPQKKRRKRVA